VLPEEEKEKEAQEEEEARCRQLNGEECFVCTRKVWCQQQKRDTAYRCNISIMSLK
jgi:hypothetical protein